ncbi:MAG: ATP-binding cassette domain-containing protein [Gammaproteobacteria bacterium]|nr:ATP-binding cassette domain-containing protein [Gammaproteobacteria bacterium]
MAIITLRAVNLGFGGPALLEHIDLKIERGERLCLVGRNGTGKSTLMKLIAGEIKADEGETVYKQGINITRLTQEIPRDLSGTIFDIVAEGLGEQGKLLAEFHHISHELAHDTSDKIMKRFEQVQHELEACGGWEVDQKVTATLTRMQLDPDMEFSALSGGLKRRVLLARALVNNPDLLMLDEPTNHLDIEAIRWLETFLLDFDGTLLFVTHDRALLKKLATRIIELDRGRLTSWPGNYETYLQRKQEALDAEATEHALFDKKLAQEEVWIRQGIKARRTRNEGRVRALEEMRQQHSDRRKKMGTVRMELQGGANSGKLVVEADHICQAYGDKTIIKDFSTVILRGDKIGILGPNGAGKTTLLKALLGEEEPKSGTIKLGTKIEVAYFDQHRSVLDESKSVIDNLAQGSDKVTINGVERHIISYLQDFLFSPERARTPVKALSGGERNRLLLARLFTRPANLLIMDEPTNDLDIETLELLEELLLNYKGTLLLVSHDRAFINNVITSTLVFEGDGMINEYVGGYDDWLRQKSDTQPAVSTKKAKTQANNTPKTEQKKKLSYKDQRELDTLPKKIEKLEDEQSELMEKLGDPDFYQQQGDVVAKTNERIAEIEAELVICYQRWETLDA